MGDINHKYMIDYFVNLKRMIEEAIILEKETIYRNIQAEMDSMRREIAELAKENQKVKQRVEILEKRERNKGIILLGVKENVMDCNVEEEITSILDNLKIKNFNPNDLILAKRIEKVPGKRPVLIELRNLGARRKIFNQKDKLSGRGLTIINNYSKEERIKYAEKMRQKQQEDKEKKTAHKQEKARKETAKETGKSKVKVLENREAKGESQGNVLENREEKAPKKDNKIEPRLKEPSDIETKGGKDNGESTSLPYFNKKK